MQISVTDAKAQLTELVRRAEAGEDIVLTRHGQPVLRFEPIRRKPTAEETFEFLRAIQASAAGKMTDGPSAARSQDFLYDEEGLPG